MVYRVELSARAERDLARLLEDSRDRYTVERSIAYVSAIRDLCRSLAEMPQRQRIRLISGHEYRRVDYKTHAIFYRVFEDEKRVLIEAVLRQPKFPAAFVRWIS